MGAKRSMGQLDYDALWRRAQYEAMREVELLYPLGDPRAREKEREITLKRFKQMAFPSGR
jgi:hypothetical protein